MSKSWEELGKRVTLARKQMGLTQVELAEALQVDRTVITKIEGGQRTVDTLELARLSKALRRPIGWFVREPPPSVVSRRADRENMIRSEDVQLEEIAQDVEQLIDLDALSPPVPRSVSIDSLEATEQVAFDARQAVGLAADEPAWDLVRIVERLGLYVFVLQFEEHDGSRADGSYIALDRGGVALIGGAASSGRRRFTIAHELGHHVLADQYAPEWVVGAGATERERVINAFAVHFLLPRSAIQQQWRVLGGAVDPRDAAIRIAAEFGTSWSATCAQLHRLGCVTAPVFDQLTQRKPMHIEFLERELRLRDDVAAPLVPPAYTAAVIRALKRAKISASRALELLHGTVHPQDLPAEKPVPLEAMTAELESFSE
ncbi:MAG TPA: XRE family transcriptional regulator [Kofleriaceae bacterium]|jgi:Zn-dependent peptidase ImmA (M78 family)/DNA-binding XRE family transcriptional regulator|nr:XRE family transcriptional regulator [Kofleriaceae bacterium]